MQGNFYKVPSCLWQFTFKLFSESRPTDKQTVFACPLSLKTFKKALTLPTNRQTMRSLKATEARVSAWHSLLELRISNIKQEMSGWFEPTMRLFVRNFASVSLFVCYALSLPESRKASKSTLFAVQTRRQRPLHTCLFFPSACVTDISRQPRVARFFSQCGLEPRPLFFYFNMEPYAQGNKKETFVSAHTKSL